jgi:hypothetical protein
VREQEQLIRNEIKLTHRNVDGVIHLLSSAAPPTRRASKT